MKKLLLSTLLFLSFIAVVYSQGNQIKHDIPFWNNLPTMNERLDSVHHLGDGRISRSVILDYNEFGAHFKTTYNQHGGDYQTINYSRVTELFYDNETPLYCTINSPNERSREYLYDYDNNNNIIKEAYREWMEDTQEWESDFETRYGYYLSPGQLEGKLRYVSYYSFWGDESKYHGLQDSTVCSYNSEKLLEQEEWYRREYVDVGDYDVDSIFLETTFEYIYNESNKLVEKKMFHKSELIETMTYTYNNEKLILHTSSNGGSIMYQYDQNIVNVTEISDSQVQSYVFYYKSTVAVEPTSEPRLLVYPNPFVDLIHVDIEEAEVSVINSVGTVMKTISSFNGGKIDLSNLLDGIYYLRVKPMKGKVSLTPIIKII